MWGFVCILKMYLLSKGCWGINFWILHNNQVSTSVRTFSELQKLLMCSWLWVLLWLWLLWHPGKGLSVIAWWLSHGITWSISVSHLKEICPPDQDYEPPDQGLCARANWVTHSHQTNVQHTELRSSKKQLAHTNQQHRRPFTQNLKNYSLIQECRFGECRFWEEDKLSSFISSQVYVLISYPKYIWQNQFNAFAWIGTFNKSC